MLRIGLADARPALSLFAPGESFRAEMRRAAHRIQAARRARLRRERREAFASLPGGVSQETLDSIAACESGGDPTAVSSDGSYRGKYQFDYGTWESVGGSSDPAAASEQEQDYRAALLYSQSGSSPWPICG
jgi:Transglycosylase-like domain